MGLNPVGFDPKRSVGREASPRPSHHVLEMEEILEKDKTLIEVLLKKNGYLPHIEAVYEKWFS